MQFIIVVLWSLKGAQDFSYCMSFYECHIMLARLERELMANNVEHNALNHMEVGCR